MGLHWSVGVELIDPLPVYVHFFELTAIDSSLKLTGVSIVTYFAYFFKVESIFGEEDAILDEFFQVALLFCSSNKVISVT